MSFTFCLSYFSQFLWKIVQAFIKSIYNIYLSSLHTFTNQAFKPSWSMHSNESYPSKNHGKHIIITIMTAPPTKEKKTCFIVLSAVMLCYQMEHEGMDRGLCFHSQDPFHGFFLLPFPNLQAASCQSTMDHICLLLVVSAKPIYTLAIYI